MRTRSWPVRREPGRCGGGSARTRSERSRLGSGGRGSPSLEQPPPHSQTAAIRVQATERCLCSPLTPSSKTWVSAGHGLGPLFVLLESGRRRLRGLESQAKGEKGAAPLPRRPDFSGGYLDASLAAWGVSLVHLRLESPKEDFFSLAERRNREEPVARWGLDQVSNCGVDDKNFLLRLQLVHHHSLPQLVDDAAVERPCSLRQPNTRDLDLPPFNRKALFHLGPLQTRPSSESTASEFIYKGSKCYSLSMDGASAPRCFVLGYEKESPRISK